MEIRVVLFDADGVVILPNRFSAYLEREHGLAREAARPAAQEEQAARPHGRRGHVADHGSRQAQVHEAHGEAAHDQPLAPKAVDGDAACTQDGAAHAGACIPRLPMIE